MRSLVVCIAIVAAVAACGGTRAVTEIDKAALAEHEAQWGQRTFHSYRFDYSESQLSTSYSVRITVVNDTLSSVIDTTTGTPPPVPRTWPTIDDLFGEADFFANNGSYSLSLDYNDTYGNLTLISAQPSNPGGGFLARVANLQPLE
ncbi:MAG: hypothetical protein H0U66_17110 [Gemmatimonadaceae bacterium]|nr:hypothetical protein [Gemmatimonadaceae bacterium]